MGDSVEGKTDRPSEFELIAQVFAPLATDTGALGLRDDAAVLMVTEGQELVVTCDTLVEGVHFLKDDPADTIGHKALAVNLSDLAAKGARGYAYMLALTLPPHIGLDWLERFAGGLKSIQERTGISLVGGDTTASPGPLTITVTALGFVAHQHAVMRLGGKPGDRLYVSGTIGDAYLGLRLLREPNQAKIWGLSDEDVAFLVDCYRRPSSNDDLVLLVRNFAQAAIDVSDGLIGDVEKLCGVSHVGARIESARVPFSEAARKVLAREPSLLPVLIAAGDDYAVVVAVSEKSGPGFESESERKGTPFTAFGVLLEEGEGFGVLDPAGRPLELKRKGFSHF